MVPTLCGLIAADVQYRPTIQGQAGRCALESNMPLLDLFWSMLVFFLFVMWIILLVRIFADIFSSSISGWSKAFWTIFVVILPLFGVLIYLIVHGGDMQRREVEAQQSAKDATDAYIRNVSGGGVGSELEKLANLHDRGVLSDSEFQTQKDRLLASRN
jgi:hypothetical protein